MSPLEKEKLKTIMDKYPKIRELIRGGNWELFWNNLLGKRGSAAADISGLPLLWHPQWSALFMTAFAEAGVDCDLEKINDYVFASTNEITSIKIPNSVVRIGIESFINCYNLTEIVIPTSVNKIGKYAFYANPLNYERKERNITIPKKFESILSEIGIDSHYDKVNFI